MAAAARGIVRLLLLGTGCSTQAVWRARAAAASKNDQRHHHHRGAGRVGGRSWLAGCVVY